MNVKELVSAVDGKHGNDVGIGQFWGCNESCNGLFNDHVDSDD